MVDMSVRIQLINERMLGYNHHLRIDFVEAKVVAGPPVRGDRARTQSERTHALRIWAAVRERKPHAGIRSVVGSRHKTRRRIDVLRAVLDLSLVHSATMHLEPVRRLP